ncbi:MAG TPA: sugar ABC transporter permease, partial [Sorangium sp.]|nr:sugar ABC transporter permease [Sorangium sp.]
MTPAAASPLRRQLTVALAACWTFVATLFVVSPACGQPLVLWHAYDEQELAALQQTLEGFDAAPVQLLRIPHDAYATKLEAAIPLGEGPDLFIDAHERLGSFLARGIVAPVNDALGDDPAAHYSAQALAAVTLDGRAMA